MPQLIAARFESIGHRDARLDGLVLDFTDKSHPCDSVLWLRNGGGKSSILNLLFSVVRPSQHEFLGSGAEGKLRELRDYVGADEVGQICLEWKLDGHPGDLPARLLTGTCIDQRAFDGQPFKRLWYSVRLPPTAPLSIRDIPIVEIGSNGNKRVLRPTALRDRLTALDDGETTVTLTDVQRDWERHLVSLGIDPAVFKYQLEMNKREGAADDLFRFNDSEEFAEFILDMVLDPSAADEVGRRLADLRHKLSRRPTLEGEQGALDRVEPRLRELARIHGARNEARQKAQHALLATAELERALSAGALSKAAAEEEARKLAAREQERHNAAAGRRHNGTWSLEVYAWRKALLEATAAKAICQRATDASRRSERDKAILDLAPALERLDGLGVVLAERKGALESTLQQHRPLLDELASAARSFVAAIDVEIEVVQARLESTGRRIEKSATDLEQAKRESAAKTESLGELKARHVTGSTRLEELEKERARLVSEGVLGEGEPAKKALQRHAEAAQGEAERARLEAEKAAGLEHFAIDKERLRSEASSDAGRAEEQRKALEEGLASAARELKALSEEAVLQRTLEDSSPDLIRLLPQAVSRLTATRAHLQEKLVTSSVESQLDRRALQSLTGPQALLPPSLDAERVQTTLRSAGLSAFTGLAYLADNLARDRAETRIRAHPELAAGVVVDETDVQVAREILSREATPVEGPVAVGTTAVLISAGEENLVVLPSQASFDRAAAVQERERRLERTSERKAQVEALQAEAAAIDEVRAKLQDWGARHPPGWLEAERRAVEERRREETEARSRAMALDGEIVEARAAAALARKESQAALSRERAERTLEARMVAFVARGGADVDALAKELALLAGEIATTRLRISDLGATCDRLEKEIESLRSTQRLAADELGALRRERPSAAEHAKGEAGAHVPLAAARERFKVRLDQVTREVGAGVLQAKIDELSKQIEGDWQRLDAELNKSGVAIKDVREALAWAGSTIGVEEARRRADHAVREARTQLVDAMAQSKIAEKDAKDAGEKVEQRKIQRRGVVEEITAACATWSNDRLSEEMLRIRGEVDAATVEEAAAKIAWEAADRRSGALESERKTLQSFLPRLRDAMTAIPDALAQPKVGEVKPAESLDGAAERVDATVGELQESLKALGSADQKAQRAVSELNSFVREDAQAQLPSQLKDRLADPNLNLLLQRAGDFAVDVEKRALTIRDELATIDQHRKVVAQALQAVSDPALRVLRRLEAASVFPPSVGVWGGSPFIRVKLRVPESAAEREAIASALIDQMVALGEIPSGLKLVKRLVRDLAGPGGLRIEILKPEPIRRLLYEPVENLGKFSRGEQLTAAILLYCTLAQQRAASRGGGRAPTSVLILDNPLGTCSNPQLVELQRAMARVHGVQLVYTTGIEDLEALARLPNIVRLKNASVDVRGRRHVRPDDERPPIQAARIALEEVV